MNMQKMNIREYIKNNRIITDGAMGTYYEVKYGRERVLSEKDNIRHPKRIKEIHKEYLEAGARLIRTNTFAANTMFLSDMKTVLKTVREGYRIAAEAVLEFEENHPDDMAYVAADLGPIYDLDHQEYEKVLQEYKAICDEFLACGADCFVMETQSDFVYIEPVTSYIREKSDAFVIVQFALDKSGYTRAGLSAPRVVAKASELDAIDAYGFNCEMDSTHMYQMLKEQTFPNEKYVSALPNAGYPYTLRGKTIYSNNASYYVDKMEQIAGLGIDIVGGCCGTTPEYIRILSERLEPIRRADKRIGVIETADVTDSKLSVFEEKLMRGEKTYIVELDPPFSNDISKVEKGAWELKEAKVDMLTISDSPMARARMDAGQLAVKLQKECKVAVMPHISCRDRNVIALRAGLLGMYMNDIRHMLIVTGDPVSRADRERVTSVFDFNSIRLMQYVQEMNQDVFAGEPLFYGGALNYHGANPDAIIARMQSKKDAGCRCFLTQPVYTAEDVKRLAYIKERIDTKLLCGIMPLVSYKNAMFVKSEMPGIHVSDEIAGRYREDMTREEAEDTAVEISVEIAEQLYEIADGFYFMTPFNRTGLIRKIIEAIRKKHEE